MKASRNTSIDAYFSEIGRWSLLTAEGERELAHRVQQGDVEARNQLVEANLRLALKIARQHMGRGLGLGDLVQEANLGLMHAAEKYDPAKGTRFSTYAALWIRQSIRRALMNHVPSVRLPAYVLDLLSKYGQATQQLEDQLGREPSFEEVVAAMEITERRQDILRQAIHLTEQAAGVDEDDVLDADALPHPATQDAADWAIEHEETDRLTDLLDNLPGNSGDVLRLRFGLGDGEQHTHAEIGRRLGLSYATVRRLERSALAQLGSDMVGV